MVLLKQKCIIWVKAELNSSDFYRTYTADTNKFLGCFFFLVVSTPSLQPLHLLFSSTGFLIYTTHIKSFYMSFFFAMITACGQSLYYYIVINLPHSFPSTTISFSKAWTIWDLVVSRTRNSRRFRNFIRICRSETVMFRTQWAVPRSKLW